MKNREHFLRSDLNTFKRKFKAVCCEQKIESTNLIKKHSEILAQQNKKEHICRIIIKDV
jgi:hypothetical protein